MTKRKHLRTFVITHILPKTIVIVSAVNADIPMTEHLHRYFHLIFNLKERKHAFVHSQITLLAFGHY